MEETCSKLILQLMQLMLGMKKSSNENLPNLLFIVKVSTRMLSKTMKLKRMVDTELPNTSEELKTKVTCKIEKHVHESVLEDISEANSNNTNN